MSTTANPAPEPPECLTISTCIGCGAMSVPGNCPGGCGPERKLELVARAELDEVIDIEREGARRAQALTTVLRRFLSLPTAQLPDELEHQAHAALRAHDQHAPAAEQALGTEPEPVVSWWCERCGGLEAPAPCIGVCIHRPARWATLQALERHRQAAAALVDDERRLAAAVRALLFTRPRPGSEARHRQALREQVTRALRPGFGRDTPADAPVGPCTQDEHQ